MGNCSSLMQDPFFSGLYLLILGEVQLDFREIKVFSSATTENVNHIVASCFEMRSRIKSLGDENLTVLAIVLWVVQIANHDKPVK